MDGRRGSPHRHGARRRCHHLHLGAGGAGDLVGPDLASTATVRRRRGDRFGGLLVACGGPRRAHVLLGIGRDCPGGDHARPEYGLPPSGLLRVRRRAPRDRRGRPLPGGRHADRAPTRRGATRLRRHRRLHRGGRARRRPDRSQLHVPAPATRRVDPVACARPVALVPGERRGGGPRPVHAARRPVLDGAPEGVPPHRPSGRRCRPGHRSGGDDWGRRVHGREGSSDDAGRRPRARRAARRRPSGSTVGPIVPSSAWHWPRWQPGSASSDWWRLSATWPRTSGMLPTGPPSPVRWGCRGPSSGSGWPSSGLPHSAACRSSGWPIAPAAGPCWSAPWWSGWPSPWPLRRVRPTGGSWPSSPVAGPCSAPPTRWPRCPQPNSPVRVDAPRRSP